MRSSDTEIRFCKRKIHAAFNQFEGSLGLLTQTKQHQRLLVLQNLDRYI